MDTKERSESPDGNMVLESASYSVMSLCGDFAGTQDDLMYSDGNCFACEGYITVPCGC